MPPEKLLTAKEKLRLSKEVYPDTYLPPHVSMTIGKNTYYRGSKSYLRCRVCNTHIGNGNAVGIAGNLCESCCDKIDSQPIPKPNYHEQNKKAYSAMVLKGGNCIESGY